MNWTPSQEFSRFSVMVIISIFAGAGSGALAGWISGSMHQQVVYRSESVMPQTSTSTTSTGSSATTTNSVEPRLTVVQVDQVPPDAIVPPAFSHQETSVAMVYQKPGKTVRVFRDEDLLGQAVAVTSDGWFVIPEELMGTRHLADVVVWYNGKALIPQRGVIDHRGSVIFLKVDSKDTKAPSFARFQDVTRGLSVWIERRPGSFEPMSITALSEQADGIVGISSDTGARRPLLSGSAVKQDIGAPIWAGNGSLVGLTMIGKEGRAMFIPSSAWAPSLFGIFSDGEVKHASLGVYAVDLSSVRLVTTLDGMPERGAWIIADGSKNPMIVGGSPAEKAGLKEGDVITEVDRDILDGRADLGEILIQYKPNASVTLKVVRDGKTIDVPVTLGSKVVSEELK